MQGYLTSAIDSLKSSGTADSLTVEKLSGIMSNLSDKLWKLGQPSTSTSISSTSGEMVEAELIEAEVEEKTLEPEAGALVDEQPITEPEPKPAAGKKKLFFMVSTREEFVYR